MAAGAAGWAAGVAGVAPGDVAAGAAVAEPTLGSGTCAGAAAGAVAVVAGAAGAGWLWVAWAAGGVGAGFSARAATEPETHSAAIAGKSPARVETAFFIVIPRSPIAPEG